MRSPAKTWNAQRTTSAKRIPLQAESVSANIPSISSKGPAHVSSFSGLRCSSRSMAARSFSLADICKLPKRAGNCDGAETRYFFSTRKKRCKQFEYSGCKGNANNFATKKECNSLCEEFKTPGRCIAKYPAFHWSLSEMTLELMSLAAECLLPVETGSCDKEITRYYFKADEELCKRFTYTGCDGNQNSFESKEACRLYCKVGISWRGLSFTNS